MDLMTIIQFAEQKQSQAYLNERLIDIYSGNLNQYVKASLVAELSAASYTVASQRVPAVNLIERITDKLSRVFNDTPNRTTADARDQEIVTAYSDSIDIQNVMSTAELILNINKNFALEPYKEDGMFKVRVLAPHEFTVYSDDPVNPTRPTAFIKYMGSRLKGKKTANVYWIYTSELFLEVDSDGEVLSSQDNPYGVIPFVYASADILKLQPKPDLDSFDNAVLIPKLLTDLNFAVRYQSFSLIYGIDVNVSKELQTGPDSFLNLKSEEGTDKRPQLGQLTPTVDVDKVISLITFTISNWLESKGITPGSGNVANNSPESAISKLVDEADASQIVNANRILLIKAEQKLWQLISVMHNAALGSDSLLIQRGLSEKLHVSIVFPTQKLITDPNEKRQQIEWKLKNKLTSYDKALKEANPDLSEDELQKLKAEIMAETQETRQ